MYLIMKTHLLYDSSKINLKGILIFVFFYCVVKTNAQTTITLQPDGINGKDTYVNYPQSNVNFGNDPSLIVGYTSTETYQFFISFNLSVIPPGYIINSAYLSLYNNPTSTFNGGQHLTTGGANTANLVVPSPWIENTLTGNTPLSITTSSSFSGSIIPATTSPNQDVTNINITNFINYLYSDPANHDGMLVQMPSSSINRAMVFASSDHPDPAKRPKLVITYSCPTGIVNTISANRNANFAGDICLNGGGLTLSAPVDPGYTYQWKNNSILIPGASSSTYNVLGPGAYTCTINSSGCNINSNTLNVKNQIATIVASGPITFCNDSVRLNAGSILNCFRYRCKHPALKHYKWN